jgi:CheY-like chemotaxis protein
VEGEKMPSGKILIVDDEADIREALRMALHSGGFRTLEAGDGQTAIDILREGDNMINVPIILCDIRMPKVNGIECIDFLRKEAPGINIVVITGYPDPQMATDLKARGIRDYLVKPVERQKLLDVVNQLVSVGKDFEL